MIPDWILSLQSSATWARRYENRASFEWDEDVVEELKIIASQLEALLSEQEERYDGCMEKEGPNGP
tara:strand:+ start:1302 stop:1499 length:198 start_codon:yes stop_codon:yes gene_type:complete